MSQLSPQDLALLESAAEQLERPSLAARLAAVVGMPVEKLLSWVPDSMQGQIERATEEALSKALVVARKTMSDAGPKAPWNLSHKVAATMAGVTGGMFGAPALVAELPVTTVIILRSIADIARSHGEDLSDPAVQLACLEVFALGSEGKKEAVDVQNPRAESTDQYIRTSYFVARAAMAQQVTAAVEILARGTTASGGSAITRLIATIASRFGVSVSEKVAAQAIPVVGAVGGGLINALFMDHFQNTAEAHFTVRKLERQYGAELVRKEYELLAARLT